MNRLQRKKLKRRSDLQILFFTFVGAFILFFVAFTYFLPIITPKVEIPALSEDYVLDSITSQDFRGRIDPRLHSIEFQEEVSNLETPEGSEEKKPETGQEKQPEPEVEESTKQEELEEQKKAAVNVPPKPKSIELREKVKLVPPVPVYRAKVVVGDFSNPKEVKIASDILLSLNYEPFIRERNGKYILQIASFSDTQKAEDLVTELKNRNFDAKIIYE